MSSSSIDRKIRYQQMVLSAKWSSKAPPWVSTQNYALNRKIIRENPLQDCFLQFTDPAC